MRAKEFLTEQELSAVHDSLDIAFKALPHAFLIPELTNSNFYDLYRFGLAIAAVRGEMGREDHVQDPKRPGFRPSSGWGQHPVVSSFDPNVGKVIDQALAKTNHKGKKAVSTPTSDEMDDTYTESPIKGFRGYQ